MIRKAMLLSVCGLLFAGAALASVPSSTNSTLPAGIRLVSTLAGVPAAYGTFTVTVRDIVGNVIPSSSVVIDVSACTPDIKIQSTQPYAGLTVDCATKTVRALTDGSGIATFDIVGRSTSGAAATFLKGKIYADGVLLGSRTIAALDIDGANGTGANDLSLWLSDYSVPQTYGRSDYDFSGALGANDLSQWLTGYSGGANVSSSPNCP